VRGTGRPGRSAHPAARPDGGAGFFPASGLRGGEGAPGSATGGLADDAGGGQMPEQAERRLRRDPEMVGRAARGDDRVRST
jgi:hypothetical protein